MGGGGEEKYGPGNKLRINQISLNPFEVKK